MNIPCDPQIEQSAVLCEGSPMKKVKGVDMNIRHTLKSHEIPVGLEGLMSGKL